MAGSKLDLLDRQRLLVELGGLGMPTKSSVADGKGAHGLQRVGVVGAELGLLEWQ